MTNERTALRITGAAFIFWFFSHKYLQHMDRTQTTDNFLGSCDFNRFNFSDVDFGRLETESRKSIKFGTDLADANCTLVCVYMSVILLLSIGFY